jgi:hypothetical protein
MLNFFLILNEEVCGISMEKFWWERDSEEPGNKLDLSTGKTFQNTLTYLVRLLINWFCEKNG